MSKPDRMFRAFSDETRLRILALLARSRELCVCDIQAVLALPQPKISRHLSYLKEAGLVRDRKAGLWKFYSLSSPENRFHRGLLGCLNGCFKEVGVLQKDAAKLKQYSCKESCQ